MHNNMNFVVIKGLWFVTAFAYIFSYNKLAVSLWNLNDQTRSIAWNKIQNIVKVIIFQ